MKDPGMDLLDDSGDEASNGMKMDGDVDENLLLNSDDEESGPRTQQPSQYTYDEEQLLYEGDEDDEFLGDETGDGDVLDLELGAEELESPDNEGGTSNTNPVRFRAHEAADSTEVINNADRQSVRDDDSVAGETDGKNLDSPPASVSTVKSTVDSDDDDDSSRQRSRFWSERKTENISKPSGSDGSGNPIQTLGERNQRSGFVGDARRGNRGGPGGRGMRFGQRGMMPHGMRHRLPSLLGDHPRAQMMRFPNYGQGPIRNENLQQLQGGFIDFSKPLRPPFKSPLQNVHPQQKPSESENKPSVPPSSAPNSVPQQRPSPPNHQAPVPGPPQSGAPHMNTRPLRPLRPQQNRMARPRGPAGNPFLAPAPVVIQGPPVGPRPIIHPQRQPLRPPQFQAQWQAHHPPIPVVIAGPGPLMGGPMPEQFNNYNGPPGMMGPGHPGTRPHFGGNQQFQPRFGEEMMRMPLPHHPAHQGQSPFGQNYPAVHEMHPPQQNFQLRPEMHRMPGPPMMQHQGLPHQQQPQRFGPPMEQQQQNWQPPHGDPHFQQRQMHQLPPHHQPPHQPQQQPPQQKLNPFRRDNVQQPDRQETFYSERYRRDEDDDHYRNGDRYRESRSESDYYDHRDSRKDYRDSDRDRYDSYESDRHYERSSHARPPLKRPSEYRDRDEYESDKRRQGSPEKRLVGRLGPPVSKTEDPEERKRKEEAKMVGVDDDYLRKLEEQKEMRARILREKEERRRRQLANQVTEESSSSSATTSQPKDSGTREVRLANSNQQSEVHRNTEAPDGSVPKKSIYINPRAFRDLSSINPNLKGITVKSSAVASAADTRPSNAVVKATTVQTQVATTGGSHGTGAEGGGAPQKKRTILRIVRNKKGEIISKSKVIVLPKGSLGGTTTTTTTTSTSASTK